MGIVGRCLLPRENNTIIPRCGQNGVLVVLSLHPVTSTQIHIHIQMSPVILPYVATLGICVGYINS